MPTELPTYFLNSLLSRTIYTNSQISRNVSRRPAVLRILDATRVLARNDLERSTPQPDYCSTSSTSNGPLRSPTTVQPRRPPRHLAWERRPSAETPTWTVLRGLR